MGWFSKVFGKPDSTKHLLDEARSLAREDRLDEAIDRYDAYVETHREDIQAYVELARLLVRAGRAAEAREFVLEIEPIAPIVLLARGEVLAACNDLNRAQWALSRAIRWYEKEIAHNFAEQTRYASQGLYDARMLLLEVRERLKADDRDEEPPHRIQVPIATDGAERGAPYRDAGVKLATIRCPACRWHPLSSEIWMCRCGHRWNTFDTRGRCPACQYQWTETHCRVCNAKSPHGDWYAHNDE